MARNREQVINDYKEFVDRIRKVGYDYSKILVMACAYLDALCENDLLSYRDRFGLLLYAEEK